MKRNICRHVVIFAVAILLSVFICNLQQLYAQIPTGQDAGSAQKRAEQIKEQEAVTKELIEKGPVKPEAEIEKKEEVVPQAPAEAPRIADTKALITKIQVNGVTVLKTPSIRSMVFPYEGKELSLADFSKIADLITSEYRKRGYVTSIAYLPPQKIENNTLVIDVTEGKIGNINLEGNRYFTKKLILHYLEQKKGDIFNYDVLRQDINYINEHPDRNAKVVLEKSATPGETDVNIKLKDQLPLHATLAYNNYNSKYLDRNRYSAELKCNNFLGQDHVASVEGQMGNHNRYYLYSGRYMMPITAKSKLGGYYVHVDQKLGGSVKDLDIKGKGDIASVYLSAKIIDKENLTIRFNPGFDYKNIENKILGVLTSRDKMRVAKLGFDFDVMDPLHGRNIITQEFDFGLKNFMNGSKHKDPLASRVNAGGDFFKSVTNAARVQALPASASLMLKGALQLTPSNLTSTEQFNIGGIYSVRGYPVSEYVGDRGYTASAELYIPPFFMSKKTKVPATSTTFYDALRLMAFFDYGHVLFPK